jgi:23S rRNA (uracil1939-C5)-methyltransferase
MANVGDEFEIRIEKIVPQGLGLGFGDKLTVFVPLTVPGDQVRVRVRQVKKRIAFADIIEVLHGGPTRTSPPCPYFGTCGGCDFQQLDYPAQLAAKVEIIRDSLKRIGKIDAHPEIAVIASPLQLGYRSRTRWHIDRKARRIGYFERNSHEIVEIQTCPKLTPGLNQLLTELRSEIEWGSFYEDLFDVHAAEGDDQQISVYCTEFADQPAPISTSVAGETYGSDAATFFQANPSIAGELVSTAVNDLTGALALDLYAGVGLFSIPLARRFERVIAVEEHDGAVDFGRKNAAAAGLANLEFQRDSVGRFLSSNAQLKPDLILLDPPRSGTEKNVISQIAGMRPAHISYVSCDPSMLARDVQPLLTAGYSIRSITACDLFPQTHHVETVMHLVL